jgi:hypothetical protein
MATICHESGENGNANNVLIPLVNGQQIHKQWFEGRALLERAQFHELHGCVRVRVAIAAGAQNPVRGVVGGGSILQVGSDYEELLSQLDPAKRRWLIRLWR